MGTGAVISTRLVLTAWHVVRDAKVVKVEVARSKPRDFEVIDRDKERDVAVLEPVDRKERLAEDLVVVPRAYWRGARPVGDRVFLALSISEADLPSSVAVALRPAPASSGHVEFVVPAARESVMHGYSGAPVLEQAGSSTPRLLGIVRARDPERVDSRDRAGTGWLVPMERIAERFAQVAALVETPIERSAGWTAHWQPRSRGVASAAEPGHFFSGREAACAAVGEHLRGGVGLAVVTGSRGRGKSAVLAHVLAGSCPRYRTLLEASDPDAAMRLDAKGVTAPVNAAALGRGRADQLAGDLARQLGFEPCNPAELVDLVARERPCCRIIIDAVNESPDPDSLMKDLVIPLSEHATVAIGVLAHYVNRHAPSTTTWINLDDQRYCDDAIPGYVTRRLRERASYDQSTATRVAVAVAERAKDNFLVAELVSRGLSARDPIDTTQTGWQEQLPTDVTDAFRDYLTRFGSRSEQQRMLALLAPLAYAHGEGLTLPAQGIPSVWLESANALRPDTIAPFTDDDLRDACERAGDYLIVGVEGDHARRLYHEGLADAVRKLASRDPDAADRAFLAVLKGLLPSDLDAPADAYDALDPYLREHIPSHLREQRQVDELLERPGLLLAADPDAVRAALVGGALTVPPALEPARIAVVYALARPHPTRRERAAALCAALQRQGERTRADALRHAHGSSNATARLPYELISGPNLAAAVSTIPDAHTGWVRALAVVEHEGRPLIISAGADGALRSWRLDGTPGPLAHDNAHTSWVEALAVVEHEGQPLIISADTDGALRSWRLDGTPGPLDHDDAHTGGVRVLAVVEHEGRPLIISAGADGALRSWRLDGTPGPLAHDNARTSWVEALAVVEHEGQPLIISTGSDGALRSWRLDGTPGPLTRRNAHTGGVRALAVVEHEGQPLIIGAGADEALRSWRLNGTPGPLAHDNLHTYGVWALAGGVWALAVARHEGQPLIIGAGSDGALRSWRLDGTPGPLAHDNAHTDEVHALAVVEHEGQPLIVSAGSDGALRSWRLDGTPRPLAHDNAHTDEVQALAVARHEGQPLIVSAGSDGALRSWRLDGTPGPLDHDDAHTGGVWALAVVEHEGRPLIVSAGSDGALRSWRLDGTPGPLAGRNAHTSWVHELAAVVHNGQPLIIGAGADGALRSWRLDGTPGPLDHDDAHTGGVWALAAVRHEGQPLIISAGADGALRSWHVDGTPGPLGHDDAHTGWVRALAVVEHVGQPLIISAGADGALRSWHVDGTPGPLGHDDAHTGWVRALAVVEHVGQPLIISAGADGALRSWHVDGTPGPLAHDNAHTGWVRALAAVRHEGQPLIISAGDDSVIYVSTLDGQP